MTISPPVQERLRAFGAEPVPEREPESRSATIGGSLVVAGCLVGVIAIGVLAVIGLVVTAGWLLG